MASLYDLTERYQNLLAVLEEVDLDEDGEELVDASISSVRDDIYNKADGYGKISKHLEYKATAARSEANRLLKMARGYENKIERLKNNLMSSMKAIGKDKIDTELFRFSVRKTPYSLEIDGHFVEWVLAQDKELQDAYLRTKAPEVDKKAVAEDLKAGEEIPHVRLVQDERLYIK